MPTLLGVRAADHIAGAARRLRDRGYGESRLLAGAVPRSRRRGIEKPSPVASTRDRPPLGVCTAMRCRVVANDAIMVGGKPFSSYPPYTIIAFELTSFRRHV